MNRKSKLGLVAVVVFALIGGATWYVLGQSSEGKINDEELSARSKEYLKKRNENADTSLQYAAIQEGEATTSQVNKVFTVDTCFSITIPFRVESSRVEEECFLYATLRTPHGSLNAYRKTEPVEKTEDIPGISMRRLNTDTYSEKREVIAGREYLIFTNTTEGFEKNAFTLVEGGYMIINISTGVGADVEQQFLQMLQSIEVVKR